MIALDIVADNITIQGKEWEDGDLKVNICFKTIELCTDDSFLNGKRITVNSDFKKFQQDLANEVTHISVVGRRGSKDKYKEIGALDVKWPESILKNLTSEDFAPQKDTLNLPILNDDQTSVGEIVLKLHVARSTDIDPDDLYFVIGSKETESKGNFPTYCCSKDFPGKKVKSTRSGDIFLKSCGSTKCPFTTGFTGQFEGRNKREKVYKCRHPFGPSFQFTKPPCPRIKGQCSPPCCECCQRMSQHFGKSSRSKKGGKPFLCTKAETGDKYVCYPNQNQADDSPSQGSNASSTEQKLEVCPRCQLKLENRKRGEVCPKCNLLIVMAKNKGDPLYNTEDKEFGKIRQSLRLNLQGGGTKSCFPKCDDFNPCCCCAYHAYNHLKAKLCPKPKKSCYYYKCGDRYPGIVLGHKECTLTTGPVPKHMGWLWNIQTLGIGEFREGWRPGAIKKCIQDMMKYFLEPFPCDTLPVGHVSRNTTPAPSVCNKYEGLDPLLRVRKHDGEYIISMNPISLNATAKEAEPLFFKIGQAPPCICNNPPEDCVCQHGAFNKEQLRKIWQMQNDLGTENVDKATEETQYSKKDYVDEDLNKVPRVSVGADKKKDKKKDKKDKKQAKKSKKK